MPEDHDSTLSDFQPALKETLLNVKQMQVLASGGAGLGLGAASTSSTATSAFLLHDLGVPEGTDGSGAEDDLENSLSWRSRTPPPSAGPSERPQTWQTALLWNSSLSNLNLIAVGRQLKYERGEESTERMLVIIKQRGSSAGTRGLYL